VGSREGTKALFKLHLDSGPVEIPDDPSLALNLVAENTKLEKYRIPEDEIKGLIQEFEEDTDASGYAASADAGG
jgi:hypothetical protein